MPSLVAGEGRLMLVLTRRREEKIVIGGTIEIMVLQVGPDEVRLGVRAPVDISVYRGELYEQIAEQNRAAARTPAPSKQILSALRSKSPREEQI